MLNARLALAVSQGYVTAPVVCLGGVADDLPEPADTVLTQQPDFDQAQARGLSVHLEPQGRYQTAIVVLPRARALAQDRIARAAALCDGYILVDGQKTDGIEAILKAVRARATVEDVIVKAHGKMIVLRPADFSDWQVEPAQNPAGFWTAPGSFSADHIDAGSAVLADNLPEKLTGHVVDLGAGWGYLAAQVLTRPGVAQIDLVEADRAALDCARRNITDTRAVFCWADATTFATKRPVDHVVMNPPFHRGRKGDPGLGQSFIASAAALLARHGHLWMVANRHLPYETTLAEHFAQIAELSGTAAFKVLHCTKPRGKGRR